MADLSPNVEVVLSSDLFDDDPCLESMSAPALAVLDAYMTGFGWLDSPTKKDCRGVAAALRAAITAVGSEEIFHPNSKRTEGVKWCVQRVYAIADELEAQ